MVDEILNFVPVADHPFTFDLVPDELRSPLGVPGKDTLDVSAERVLGALLTSTLDDDGTYAP